MSHSEASGLSMSWRSTGIYEKSAGSVRFLPFFPMTNIGNGKSVSSMVSSGRKESHHEYTATVLESCRNKPHVGVIVCLRVGNQRERYRILHSGPRPGQRDASERGPC